MKRNETLHSFHHRFWQRLDILAENRTFVHEPLEKWKTRNLPHPVMNNNIEHHPFEPFIPKRARIIMLGTFPPARHRWCMPFYYPNFQNDMWRIMGILFFNDKEHFIIKGEKRFDQPKIEAFLKDKGIAMYDTATKIVRTKNTASDKDLDIIEETDVEAMLDRMPQCTTIITAGQLATTTLCHRLGVKEPKVGDYVELDYKGRQLRIYRMPSTSRAYPMKPERKAEQHAKALH